MHRVRTSLPYFKQFGWEAEIVAVQPLYTDIGTDDLLCTLVPKEVKIHYVRSLDKRITSKIGLGAVALRALPFYRAYVNKLLSCNKFDLIYFSTTQFPVCVLGPYWLNKFKVPYVIDMQDPWHSNYYQGKPRNEQPAKYWFSYRLNKFLEPVAMKAVSGLISVSEDYTDQLKNRYPNLQNVPAATITFGMYKDDVGVALENSFPSILDKGKINIVYAGRGGADMHTAITPVFSTLSKLLQLQPNKFKNVRLYFIGTSYAPANKGTASFKALARQYGIEQYVIEQTNRLSYYHTLNTLSNADALFIPGSDDSRYTASKIFPYLMVGKPILGLFHPKSSALKILKDAGINTAYDFDTISEDNITAFINGALNKTSQTIYVNADVLKEHSAEYKTGLQCQLFEQAIKYANNDLPIF
ncbi:glycosyltransferase family 4 protein [Mucilaginibacter pallidiroseus]|uniref:Glycosyltransferase family 4 protein n=2 Tax=Mucilaginibacter pallidiroseus TaxID=2599295 RepID=A0A563U1I8_9SPHI|nr:glycosyltransferase family 4 protein [Mucilaginibacter pallidiroseus]